MTDDQTPLDAPTRTKRKLAVPVIVAAAGALVIGCGSDSGTTTTTAAATQGSAPHGTVVDMAEFSYSPAAATATAEAGSVTISAKNVGQLPHELVLARTSSAPDRLPTLPDGSVDEDKLDAQGKAPGEIPETEAGATKSAKLKLAPGRYVMYCNLPGHYAGGMYGSLVVK